MRAAPEVKLNNDVVIPQLGFGVYLVAPEETERAVTDALEAGYRHIDTAQMYRNESQVATAIAQSGLERSEVFVTSKLANESIGYDAALEGFDASVEAMGLDWIDLFLIHWPLAAVRDFVETWRAFERLYADGRVRAIGVSNFQIPHLLRILDEAEIPPAVNQIELHPYLTQEPLRAFHAEHGIATEAWSPLGRGTTLADPTVVEIARAHDKTPAQIVLGWHLALGNIAIPKSVHPARIRENFASFDFELSAGELAQISALNRDQRIGPDPDRLGR